MSCEGSEVQCAFFIDSTSQFEGATFQVFSSHRELASGSQIGLHCRRRRVGEHITHRGGSCGKLGRRLIWGRRDQK